MGKKGQSRRFFADGFAVSNILPVVEISVVGNAFALMTLPLRAMARSSRSATVSHEVTPSVIQRFRGSALLLVAAPGLSL
jgi:hypothetical protein